MKSYQALIIFFEEEAASDRDPSGTARGLSRHLTNYRYDLLEYEREREREREAN